MSIYLDHNATTPLNPKVREVIQPFLDGKFGNPSSAHHLGQEVRFAIDEARESVASLINADPSEIIFTSSGTESNNLALYGVSCASQKQKKHIISNRLEHPAILRVLEILEKKYGHQITYIETDKTGKLLLTDIEKAIQPNTILMTFMRANNETGTLHPIDEIGQLAREKNVFFHSDYVQALGKVPVDVKQSQVMSASFSGHKIGALKGVGFLYLDCAFALNPLIVGGGQEQGRRGGTENVMGIIGLGAACRVIEEKLEQTSNRSKDLRDKLEYELSQLSGFEVNGDRDSRLPNTLNASFEGVSGETLLLRLDQEGIAVSSGSACASGSTNSSHVLLGMGLSKERTKSAIRFSLGAETTGEEIETTAEAVKRIVGDLRS